MKFLLTSLVFLIFSTQVWSQARTALVIGNSNYQDAPLFNPEYDAKDMASTLKSLNFDVIERVNVDRKELRHAIRKFAKTLKQNGGVGLFYYAGHGIQVDGDNYIVPLGADVVTEEEIIDEGVQVNAVLRAMEAAENAVNIVILDACRNNPFARSFRSSSRGLVRMDGPTGSYIAFATAPGSVALDGQQRNGVYTRYLLREMTEPGLTLEQVFKRVRVRVEEESQGLQVPWESSSLRGDFFFVPPELSAGKQALQEEVALWELVKQSNNLQDVKAFMSQYPNSIYALAASLRAEQLMREEITMTRPKVITRTDNLGPLITEANGLLAGFSLTLERIEKSLVIYEKAQALAESDPRVNLLRQNLVSGLLFITDRFVDETNWKDADKAIALVKSLASDQPEVMDKLAEKEEQIKFVKTKHIQKRFL